MIIALAARVVALSVGAYFGGDLPPMYPHVEPYEDYLTLYTPQVDDFLTGRIMYQEFFHAYPPPFMYLLALGKLGMGFLGGAVLLVAMDLASVYLVYLISKRGFPKLNPVVPGLAVALSPVLLWYNDVLWLNPPASTVLMLVTFYFLQSKRGVLSYAVVAVASMIKQTSVVMLPGMLGSSGLSRRGWVASIIVLAAIPVGLSLPFLIWFPGTYLWAIGVPGLPTPQGYAPTNSTWRYTLTEATDPTDVLGVLGFPALAEMVNPWLGVVLIMGYGFLMWRSRRGYSTTSQKLSNIVFSIALFLFLFPRGSYKYYFAALVPFLAFYVRGWREILLFMIFNLALIFTPRLATPWFAVLIFAFITAPWSLKRDEDASIESAST
jgi:hypothetical protein